MKNYNKFLRNIAELIEKGLLSSKDLKKEAESTLKFKMDNIVNRLNLVSREEFEVLKKMVQKQDLIIKKLLKSKKTKKVKKF